MNEQYGGWYLDRLLAHELTHAAIFANVNYGYNLPNFIHEGLAEFTHGTDDIRKSAITSLASDYDRLKAVLTSTSDDGYYEGGYIFFRYLAEQFGGKYIYNSNNNTIVSGSAYDDTIRSVGQNVKVYGKGGDDDIYVGLDKGTVKSGVGNDTLQAYGTNVKIYGENGNDSIIAYTSVNKATLSGGVGNDLLYSDGTNIKIDGGNGNDYVHLYNQSADTTVTGGKGNDTIKSYSGNKVTYVYESGEGKDVIDGFNFGTDNLKINGVPTTYYDYSGDDIIFTIGSTSVTVKNGKGKTITINGTERNFNSAGLLFEENNFVTADNLSQLVENNSVGEFEFNSSEKLTQENLITYAAK